VFFSIEPIYWRSVRKIKQGLAMGTFTSAESTTPWAQEEFGEANLGDARRTSRLVKMAACAAQFPSGKLTEVFQTSADRQGAYKLVENEAVHCEAIAEAMGRACAKRCINESFVYILVDGSSVRLTDRAGTKDYGAVGSFSDGARGIQVITALGLDSEGIPIGVGALTWWNRLEKVSTPSEKRSYDEKEVRYWGETIRTTCVRFKEEAPNCRLWFIIDREADAMHMLLDLDETGQYFTVRAQYNRRVESEYADPAYVFDELAPKRTRKGSYTLNVSAAHNRSARTARMNIHIAPITLLLRNPGSRQSQEFPVYAVHVRETSRVPDNEDPIEWLLYTNYPIKTLEDALLVVQGYMNRWRIEDYHRCWKSGVCDIESTQLQTTKSVKIWATMLGSIAARAERIKHLARENPNLPAIGEFSVEEVEALTLLKRRRKKKNETIPDGIPTIATVVLWLAEIGGYTGKSSGGPPGSTTIARGLERLQLAAELLRIQRE
jgi:Transposase DNA-binding/Transposase DDE domain